MSPEFEAIRPLFEFAMGIAALMCVLYVVLWLLMWWSAR